MNDCLGTTTSVAVQYLYIGKKTETFYNIPVVQSCILDISKEFLSQRSLFLSCQYAKKGSKFQNTAFLLVVIKIWIYFVHANISKKETYKQETSLLDRLSSIPQRLGFIYHINMK